jgi:hypothetical protein
LSFPRPFGAMLPFISTFAISSPAAVVTTVVDRYHS